MIDYIKMKDNQKWLRTHVAICALAYDRYAVSFISDSDYDTACRLVDTSIETDRIDLDRFFSIRFSPDTGQWVYLHPDLKRLDFLVRGMLSVFDKA